MMTPPLSIWARPFLVAQVEIAGVTFDTLTSDDRARVAIAGRLDSGVLARTERRGRHVGADYGTAPPAGHPLEPPRTGAGARRWSHGRLARSVHGQSADPGATVRPCPHVRGHNVPHSTSAPSSKRAVQRNEFGLEYQPIIDLTSGSIAAVEALLRWRHPLLGTIAPGDYLPLAEESGLIVPIGERVLDAATRQLRTWHLGFARMQSLTVNVNVSRRQLTDPGFVEHVETVLRRSDLSPAALTLELGPDCVEHG